jgi:hypothetical protein
LVWLFSSLYGQEDGVSYAHSWAYGKEKIRGAEWNLPDFFGLYIRMLGFAIQVRIYTF